MARSIGIKTESVGFGQSLEEQVRKINRRGMVVKVQASDFTQPLGRMSAKANEFTKSLEASNARVIAFGASAAIIGGVTASFVQLVAQASKVEKILTDINVVLNTTSQNLSKFGDGLFKVARNTSQSLETAAEAALEFSRQGLSMEETLRRTNDALILTRLTGLKAADSVKGLTAAVNGFADAGLTTTEIINKLAAVDVKFAVSADDLINALSRAGAVAQDAGVSFDQLVGAVTAAQQITARGGAVIGNSFKTIFTRVQRSSTINRLEELGIAVRNLKGETLPALTVLSNLSKAYEDLQASTKSAVAEQVGGVFQINVLKAALKDLNKETSLYSQATEIAGRATNEAQTKNAQLQQTLSSIANQTLTSVRELTAGLGELTIAPALKNFLSLANDALQGLNEMFGGKEGEDAGSAFARGIAKGIGSVLTGPGVLLTLAVFGKLFVQAFKFAKGSIKDLLQITSIKDRELAIQESIVDAMIQNRDLSKQLVKLDGDQAKQEELVLGILREQTKHLEMQRKIAASMAPSLRRQGVQPNLIVDDTQRQRGSRNNKTYSSGFIPNYASNVTPLQEAKEKAGALKGGYVAGSVASINIPSVGRAIYNKNEAVKYFSGFSQPAIMPPALSGAGQEYKNNFISQHGFNPYEDKQGSQNNETYSRGLIPNFSKAEPAESSVEGKTYRKSFLQQNGFDPYERPHKGSQNNETYFKGFLPNFAKEQYTERQVTQAITKALTKRGIRINARDRNQISFASNRYLSATKEKDYPGGTVTIGRHKIQMNEITLALKRLGDYMSGEGADGPVIGETSSSIARKSNAPMSDTMAWLTGSQNNKTYNQGFIPNFAGPTRFTTFPQKVGGTLFLPKAKMFLQSVGDKTGWHQETAPLADVSSRATGLRAMFQSLERLGISHLSRPFYFADRDPRIKPKQNRRYAATKVPKGGVSNDVRGTIYEQKLDEAWKKNKIGRSAYQRTDTSKYKKIGKKYVKVGGTGDHMGVVDFVSKGRIPIEAKTGFAPGNVLAKSVYQASDRSVERFLEAQGVDMADVLQTKQDRALRTVQSLRGQGNTLEDALSLGLYSGFIPNFINLNRRNLSSRDKMSDRQRLLKMWQDKMAEVKAIAQSGKPRIETGPIISKKNAQANEIWDQLQLLKAGKNYFIPNFANFIPNFADPLSDAIDRERSAMSGGKIYVDQDSRLKNQKNPMGLLVANTKDEPAGGYQGVNRAIAMGMDPTEHGSQNNATYSAGYVPNYNVARNIPITNTGLQASIDKRLKSEKDLANEMQNTGMAVDGVSGKLIGLTTLTYAFGGGLTEVEGTMGKVLSTVNAVVMGATQASLVAGLGRQSGANLREKGKATGGFKGGAMSAGGMLLGAAGPAAAVAALAIPVFNSLKENFDGFFNLVATSAEKMERSFNVASRRVENFTGALQAAQTVTDVNADLQKLEQSAIAGTFEGRMKEISLQQSRSKANADLNQSVNKLAKDVNVSSAELRTMLSGSAAGLELLQQKTLDAQESLEAISNFQTYLQGLGSESILGFGGKDDNEIDKARAVTGTAAGLFGETRDIDEAVDGIQELIKNFDNISEVRMGRVYSEINNNPNLSMAEKDKAKMGVRTSIFMGDDSNPLMGTTTFDDFEKIIAESDLPDTLKGLASEFLKQKEKISFEDFANMLKKVEGEVQEFAKELEETNQDVEAMRNAINEGKNLLEESINTIKRRELLDQQTLQATENYLALRRKQAIDASDLSQLFGEETKAQKALADNLDGYVQKREALDAKEEALRMQYNRSFTKLIKDTLTKGGPQVSGNLFDEEKGLKADAVSSLSENSGPVGNRMKHVLEKTVEEAEGALTQYHVMAAILKVMNEDFEESAKMAYLKKQIELNNITLTKEQAATLTREVAEQNKREKIQVDTIKSQKELNDELAKIDQKTISIKEGLSSEYQESLNRVRENAAQTRATALQDLTNANNTNSIQLAVLSVETEALRTLEGRMELMRESYNSQMKSLDAEERSLIAKKALLANDEKLAEIQLKRIGINMGNLEADLDERRRLVTRRAAGGYYATKAQSEVGNSRLDDTERFNTTANKARIFAREGNQNMKATTGLSVAEQARDMNFNRGTSTGFEDQIAVRLAQVNVELVEFNKTLANVSFDSLRDGLKDFIKDIGDSTKSIGDAALKFVHGIVSKIHDAFLDRAVNQLIAGVGEVTGLNQVNLYGGSGGGSSNNATYKTGGIVSKYAVGGSVGAVPAMLTSGEYVVRKKIVDRLGRSNLDKINETGSLEDLFNKPNDVEDFDVYGSQNNATYNNGGIVQSKDSRLIENFLRRQSSNEETLVDSHGSQNNATYNEGGIVGLKDGGSIESYLKKRNLDDNRISQNERSTVNGQLINDFTNSVMKFMGGLVKFKDGGFVSRHFGYQESGYGKIAQGGGYLAGSAIAQYEDREPAPYTPPTAPTKPTRLNTRSTLDLDPTGRQMSARYRATDTYSKDYGNYLLSKYQYDVNYKNQKVQERANMLQGIVNSIGSMGMMYLGNSIAQRMAYNASTTPGQRLTNDLNRMNAEIDESTANTYNYSSNFREDGSRIMSSQDTARIGETYDYLNKPTDYNNTFQEMRAGTIHESMNDDYYTNDNLSMYDLDKFQFRNQGGLIGMSGGGKVHGPAGIDKVGPIMLDRGEYVIKASSVNSVEKQFPGFFDQLNSMKMNQGGIVDPQGNSSTTTTNNNSETNNTSSSSNITVNINVSSGGTSTEGGDGYPQELGGRLRDAVIGVISQEKRVGGMLRG